jgi:hypothetical protein
VHRFTSPCVESQHARVYGFLLPPPLAADDPVPRPLHLPFTDQIEIGKQRIRTDIGARNGGVEVLDARRLLRLIALL